jgi:hypothetical protein
MSQAVVNHEVPATIAGRLHSLRRQVQVWFWIDGLGRVLLGALLIFAVDLFLDWQLRLTHSQRVVMWLLMAGSILALIYRRLVLPLSSQIGDDALLLEVERRHKELGQSVISAAQFSRIGDIEHLGVSPEMVAATIQRGVDQAGQIKFGDVLNSQRWWANLYLLLLAVGLTGGLAYGVVNWEPLGIWFNRNLVLGDSQWPQQTYLEIVGAKDGVVTLPRGESWTQRVLVRDDSEVLPDAIYIDYYPGRRPSQLMKRVDKQTFETTFPNVIEEFQFRARGGDAATDIVKVQLVEPPAVSELSLKVTLPKYAGSVVEELASGRGPFYVLKGSSLVVSGVANKPLSKAELYNAEPPTGSAASEARIPLQLTDKLNFSGELLPEQLLPGKYVLELTDSGGLTSKRPTTFVINTKADAEPRFLHAKLVGVSGMIVPQANVPYTAKVRDDFQVTQLKLGYRWRGEDGTSSDIGYAEPQSLASALPSPTVEVDDAIDIAPFKLEPGSTLTLFLEATDNDDISGPKTGKSPDFLIRVVTEEQLRADLLRREKEQRQELERLLKTEEDLITDVEALAAGVNGTDDFTDEQRLALMALQKRQNLLSSNVSSIAEIFTAITTEVLNNRLEEPGGKLESRLREQIIAPLHRIADLEVDSAVLLLERARRAANKPQERDQALTETKVAQEQIARSMREILIHMAKAEGYQEAINLLYELEKAQKDVLERTMKEKEERNRRILEGGGTLPPEDAPEKTPDAKPAPDQPAPAAAPPSDIEPNKTEATKDEATKDEDE